jgi:hypothetical protein
MKFPPYLILLRQVSIVLCDTSDAFDMNLKSPAPKGSFERKCKIIDLSFQLSSFFLLVWSTRPFGLGALFARYNRFFKTLLDQSSRLLPLLMDLFLQTVWLGIWLNLWNTLNFENLYLFIEVYLQALELLWMRVYDTKSLSERTGIFLKNF